jgi:beta-glucosidase
MLRARSWIPALTSAAALVLGLGAAAPASAAPASRGYAESSVGSQVTTTLSPQAVLVAPGQPATDTISSTNASSSSSLKVTWIAAPLGTSGITVTPATGTVTIAPGATVSTSLTVITDASTPGTTFIPFTVSVAVGRTRVPAVGAYLTTTTPDGSLGDTFDNVGVSDDSAPAAGNFDGNGNSYSAQALADAGITPGRTVTSDGVTFTWPDIPAGIDDNVIAASQTVLLSGSGSTLGFLGTAVNGAFTETGNVYYTDGSTQQFTISFVNWTSGSPPTGDTVVATTSYLNTPTGQLTRNRYLYGAFVPLDPSKTVEAVQLPSAGSGDIGIHIFAVAVG